MLVQSACVVVSAVLCSVGFEARLKLFLPSPIATVTARAYLPNRRLTQAVHKIQLLTDRPPGLSSRLDLAVAAGLVHTLLLLDETLKRC